MFSALSESPCGTPSAVCLIRQSVDSVASHVPSVITSSCRIDISSPLSKVMNSMLVFKGWWVTSFEITDCNTWQVAFATAFKIPMNTVTDLSEHLTPRHHHFRLPSWMQLLDAFCSVGARAPMDFHRYRTQNGKISAHHSHMYVYPVLFFSNYAVIYSPRAYSLHKQHLWCGWGKSIENLNPSHYFILIITHTFLVSDQVHG